MKPTLRNSAMKRNIIIDKYSDKNYKSCFFINTTLIPWFKDSILI